MDAYELWGSVIKVVSPKHAMQVRGAAIGSAAQSHIIVVDNSDQTYHLFYAKNPKGSDVVMHSLIGSLEDAKLFFKKLYGDDCEFDGSIDYFEGYHEYQHNIAARAISDEYIYGIKNPMVLLDLA